MLDEVEGKTPEEINNISLSLDLREKLTHYANMKAKDDFLTFVKIFAPTIVSDFKMGRHIELLCEKLQGVIDGSTKRLMIFLPPRSSKSVVASKLFPAWYIGNFANHEIMSVSHSDQLASDFGRTVRDIVNTEKFQKIFRGVSLRLSLIHISEPTRPY